MDHIQESGIKKMFAPPSVSPKRIPGNICGWNRLESLLLSRQQSKNLQINVRSSSNIANILSNNQVPVDHEQALTVVMFMNYYHILRSYKGYTNMLSPRRNISSVKVSPNQSLARVFGLRNVVDSNRK